MLVILPSLEYSINELQSNLTNETMQGIIGQMQPSEVELFLPKFNLKETYTLNQPLKNMGLNVTLSANQADFSNMGGSPGELSVGTMMTQTFISVAEGGTEAAGATSVIIRVTSLPMNPTIFNANRPFLFFIMDDQTKSILFLGRLGDPS